MTGPMTRADGNAGKLPDLRPRLLSGLVLALVGIGVVVQGGTTLLVVVALCVGVMIWELARFCDAADAPMMGLASGVSCFFVLVLPGGYGLPFLMLPAFIGIARVPEMKVVFAIMAVLVLLAGFGIVRVRAEFGPGWMAWLICVVIASDIAGYFAGRLIGGPRFWPRVSPKKTWSGTVAGWIAAAFAGLAAQRLMGGGGEIVALSVALSMAAQLGDLAESALKRRAGVKDSSGVLPGHGGLFDRFDGLLGATVLFLMVERVVGFPPVPAGG